MRFHVCAYCQKATSSGDLTLHFENGTIFEIPAMIAHYVRVHGYKPDDDFIEAIQHSRVVLDTSVRWQTRSLPKRVGYLSGPLDQFVGPVPDGFLDLLVEILTEVAKRSHCHITY